MSRIPAFRHMGGKARLRKWLVDKFPSQMDTYREPFVGKGNVFFLARTELTANRAVLSDVNVDFLLALRYADLSQLPESVTRETFEQWRNNDSHIARLLEPRITFAGKGYKYGFSGSSGTHVGYSKECYQAVCEAARELLGTAEIRQSIWNAAIQDISTDDFVYLDPPYYGTSASYMNIDHEALIEVLNCAQFRWALSGYDNELYQSLLHYARHFTYERNSEIKSSNTGHKTPVVEHLWVNY